MAIKTESIQKLINGMTAAEKAYFKKFGFKKGGSGQQKMLQMFEMLNNPKLAKPEAWEAALAKAGIDNAALYRNRLFEALAQSLREYQASHSAEETLYRHYRMADILISRGLVKEAVPILRKAIEKALRLNLSEYVLLLEQKHHLAKHLLGNRQAVGQSLKHRQSTAETVARQMHLASVYEEVYQLQLAEGREPAVATRKRLLLLAHETLGLQLPKDDFKAQLLRLNILHTVYFNLGDNPKSLEHSLKIVQLFQDHPSFIVSRPQPYLLSWFNFLSDSLNCGQTDLFHQNIGQLEHLGKAHPALAADAERLTLSLQADFYLAETMPETIPSFLERFEAWYQNTPKMGTNNQLDLLARMAYLLFKARLPSKSLDYVLMS